MEKLTAKIREKLDSYHQDFIAGVEAQHRRLSQKLGEGKTVPSHYMMWIRTLHFIRAYKIDAFVTSPFIYMLLVPIVMLDLFMTLYQQVCFRVYRIPRVRRGDYVVMDRSKLQYLSPLQKLNCIYCEYANGVLSYAHEVAARTEQFWCPIKHGRKVKNVHDRYDDFIEYGDNENFPKKFGDQREKCRACEAPSCGKSDKG
jgi:hypothetical protein